MRLRANLAGALVVFVAIFPSISYAQFDVLGFDPTSEGPWSNVDLTTVTVPQVIDASITLDGKPSNSEYGGFEGVTVTPGDNAWLLDFPGDRQWDDEADSSFTFWLAHDTDFLYVGIDAKDDIVNSDDTNAAFWKDDAIEIVTDVWNDNYDNNTDNSMDAYGGHFYVNYEGRFSRWDDELEEIQGTTFSTAVTDWTYGDGEGDDTDDIFGFGEETETGWNMEIRMNKRLFEDPDAEIKLVEGTKMGFNIGLDDDDKFGIGENGDGSRTQDLELQYFWANRQRFLGWTQAEDELEIYTEEEIADSFEKLANGEEDLGELGFYDVGINPTGRLSHAGAGEIIFGGLTIVDLPGDCNGDGVVDASDLACVADIAQRDAVLEALNTLPGDLDGNGEVAFADFLVLSTNFNAEGLGYTEGNIDLVGAVAFPDFLALSTNFNKTPGGASAVPEPAGLSLLGLGTMLLGVIRRRRKVTHV